MIGKTLIFVTILSLSSAGLVKRCTDCNRVGGVYVNNNVAPDTSTDAVDIATNNLLRNVIGLDEGTVKDGSVVGVGNVGGLHEVRLVREERCEDCGNRGGTHTVINECTDCLNKGGQHTNNLFNGNRKFN